MKTQDPDITALEGVIDIESKRRDALLARTAAMKHMREAAGILERMQSEPNVREAAAKLVEACDLLTSEARSAR